MSASGQIRVYLVDDVKELRELVRIALEEDPGIEVVGEAANGREGVAGVAELQPDVVLLDLSMPDMDGLEAIPLMRESAPESRLVVLSGHEAGRVSLEALDQGATRYLNKGADFDAIRATVHDVARMEPPYTDDRFRIVHRMWSAYLNGMVDAVLEELDEDVIWHPYTGAGQELTSHDEARACLHEAWSSGNTMGPRAYGVEPHGRGLMVLGSLEIRGAEGRSETPVYWAFCFRGAKVALAVGVDRREEALQVLRERCAA